MILLEFKIFRRGVATLLLPGTEAAKALDETCHSCGIRDAPDIVIFK